MDDSTTRQYVYTLPLARRIMKTLGLILCTIVVFYLIDGWTRLEDYRNSSSLNCLGKSRDLERKCQWYFVNYTPSAWESIWYKNIDEYQNDVCERLSNPDNLMKTVSLVERLVEVRQFGRNKTKSDKQMGDEYLSRMFYRKECLDTRTNITSEVREISHLIEPLIGLLRDPFTICARVQSLPASLYQGLDVQSKRIFLLGVSAPLYDYSLSENHQKNPLNQTNEFEKNILPWMYQRLKLNLFDTNIKTIHRQNILIDLGSTYFGVTGTDSAGDAGRWFYEYYKRFNVKFDRIIAYEYAPLDTKAAWEQLPDDVFPVFTLINVGCAVDGTFNPWKTLKALAKPHDHVIVKLDIDTSEIEIPLINQLLADSSIHSLVDEMFFEHHITVKDMLPYWGNPPGTLKDSYILFTKIRQLGIRMHAWP